MQPGQALDLGSGAILTALSTDARGAVLLLKWDDFRATAAHGNGFYALETLQNNSAMRNISAVLLAESGYAPLNPPELIAFLHPQLALLSVAPGDKTGLPSPETLEALEGYSPAAYRPERLDRNNHRWKADVGGGGEEIISTPEDCLSEVFIFFTTITNSDHSITISDIIMTHACITLLFSR